MLPKTSVKSIVACCNHLTAADGHLTAADGHLTAADGHLTTADGHLTPADELLIISINRSTFRVYSRHLSKVFPSHASGRICDTRVYSVSVSGEGHLHCRILVQHLPG